jgi:hypothetical protein
MNWVDINKEKPQEGVKYFFKIYYGNNAEEKLVGYYYNKKGKEYFSEAFDGETYKLEELTECYWLKEESKELNWQVLEEKFCKEWNKRIFANNRMQYWEINQWYKDNV